MRPASWLWTWASCRWCRPTPHRLRPWKYDQALYAKRNEVERLFRRLKGFRRIFSRFDKLDVMFTAFIHFALVIEALR
jgi:transposase